MRPQRRAAEEAARKAAEEEAARKAAEEAAAAEQADDVIGHRFCWCTAGASIRRHSGLDTGAWESHLAYHAARGEYPIYEDLYGADDPWL